MIATELLQPHEGPTFPTMRELTDRAYAVLADRSFNTTITYGEFHEALDVNPAIDRRARAAVLKAGKLLQREHKKKLVNIRTVGYRIIKPTEHVEVSQGEQRRARRWLRESLKTVTHVALEDLQPTDIARVMTEQARAAIQVAMTRSLARTKALPSRDQLCLPSATKLLEMMRKPSKT